MTEPDLKRIRVLADDVLVFGSDWSPDGSRIALGHQNACLFGGAPSVVIDADGSGDAMPLDDLTYESWRGGSYDCDCEIFG